MTRFGPQILTRLGGRTARVARAAGARLRNEVAAGGFAERAGGNGLVPNAGIAVFFATGPENLYQFEQWRRPLERLAERQPVFMITDRADTGDALLASTSLPLAFARGSAALEELVDERDVRIVLYLNQLEANFRMLRFASPVHIQIGHGESDKDSKYLQPAQGVRPGLRGRRRGSRSPRPVAARFRCERAHFAGRPSAA